jgi:hypothetical protein
MASHKLRRVRDIIMKRHFVNSSCFITYWGIVLYLNRRLKIYSAWIHGLPLSGFAYYSLKTAATMNLPYGKENLCFNGTQTESTRRSTLASFLVRRSLQSTGISLCKKICTSTKFHNVRSRPRNSSFPVYCELHTSHIQITFQQCFIEQHRQLLRFLQRQC